MYRADDFEKDTKEQSNTDSLNFQLMTYQDFMSHHNHAQQTKHKYHVQHRSGTVRRHLCQNYVTKWPVPRLI